MRKINRKVKQKNLLKYVLYERNEYTHCFSDMRTFIVAALLEPTAVDGCRVARRRLPGGSRHELIPRKWRRDRPSSAAPAASRIRRSHPLLQPLGGWSSAHACAGIYRNTFPESPSLPSLHSIHGWAASTSSKSVRPFFVVSKGRGAATYIHARLNGKHSGYGCVCIREYRCVHS